MKKCFALLIILTLLLAGCGNGDAEITETTIPTETDPPSYYFENSDLEVQTNGAVRQYILPQGSYSQVALVADQLLLVSDAELTQMCMLSSDEGIPVAQLQLEGVLAAHCQPLRDGFAYYDALNKQAIFMDSQLRQTCQIDLPDQISGSPVFSPDGSSIFYCTGQEIRAMDTQNNISRLVKTQGAVEQSLLGTCFEGKLLICEVKDGEGNADTQYISSQNGQTITTDNSLSLLFTSADKYFVQRMDGPVQQHIVGTLDGQAQILNATDPHYADALAMGGIVGYNAGEKDLVLNYYDLVSGKRTSSVTLPGIAEPKTVLADKASGCIWLLVADPAGAGELLLRWDIRASAVQDETAFVGPLYTMENPDTGSMDALSERIDSLNKKHGVRIRIWKEAVENPGDHTLTAEYQVSAITDMLDQLEAVLNEFPQKFVSKSISSKVRICLVRSVNAQTNGVQYWIGRNAYIALCSGTDIRSEFLKAFGSVVDSHVLGNSAKYDYWDTLNPKEFAYGTADESLLAGENRAFVDADSMISGSIDRSRVFWQAMLPDNAEMFKSEIMQQKLTMLCKAIRDAWNTKKSKDVFPWEQYLEESIAYKK